MLVRLLYVSTEIIKQPSNFAELNLEKFRLHNKRMRLLAFFSVAMVYLRKFNDYLRLNDEH